MQRAFTLKTVTSLLLTASTVLFGYLIYRFVYPPTTEDVIANARKRQPAIKAAIETLDINPHDILALMDVRGTQNDGPAVVQFIILHDRSNCCIYDPATRKITTTLPENFIFTNPQ